MVAKVAVISADSVLVQRDDPSRPFLSMTPLPEGLALMRALGSVYRIAVTTSRPERAHVVEWLALHGLESTYSYVVERRAVEAGLDDVALAERHLAHLRGMGFSVDLWIDSLPDVLAMCIGKGVPGLLFAHPVYGRHEWRPDVETGVKPWDTLVEEMERQSLLKAADGRLNADPEDVLDGRWEREHA